MNCAACDHPITEVMSLGEVALAGAYVKPVQFHAENKYLLRIGHCESCGLVQVMDPVSPDLLFTDYFYRSSQIAGVREHFDAYAKALGKHETVLEIGCNDGYLLGKIADHGAKCIGVDPAKNILDSVTDKRLTLINAFFNEETAREIVAEHGQQSLILANNVFAHVGDINGMVRGMRHALKRGGQIIIETHYLQDMIDGLQYDWIYHEHQFYWSAEAISLLMERHGLRVFKAQRIPSHGGSVRWFVGDGHHHFSDNSVAALLACERINTQSLREFASRCAFHARNLYETVASIRNQGKTISGYGAGGRANTILQYAGIGSDLLAFVIDDSPARQGHYTPGTHLPIYSRDNPKATQQSHYLILAWPYADQIRKQAGGAHIVPLPNITTTRERAAA